MNQHFASECQSIGASAKASVLMGEYSGLISFRIDWSDLLAVKETLKSFLQHYNSKTILWCSAFFVVKIAYPYVTTGKTMWLSWWRIRLQRRRLQFNSWVGKIHWRRDRLCTPVFLGFPRGSGGKESTCYVGDLGSIPGLRRSPVKGKAPCSSILAWIIPWAI